MTEPTIAPPHDVDHVLEVVREIVAEKPEASYADVYSQAGLPREQAGSYCEYFTYDEDGTRIPLCLVGQVLAKDGYLYDLAEDEDSASWMTLSSSGVVAAQHYTAEANSLLNSLQMGQDNNVETSWASLLEAVIADKETP
jgi:hypothetical protein